MKLAVIGGGVAGVAAAQAALAAGAELTFVHDRAGASALYSGALDFDPERAGERLTASGELASLASVLGWRLGPCVIASAQGNARPASGRDAALLDLAPLAGKRIALADLGRDDWDAALLAKSYGASAWAKQTRTTFVAVPVAGLASGAERRIAPYDLAALHDQPERVEFLAAALKSAPAAADAWLLGPWLGLERPAAAALVERLGLPVGEAASQPGGAAGARFELMRERWLAQNKLAVRRAHVTRVEPRGARYALHAGAEELAEFAAVVLAIGGMVSGGIALAELDGQRAAAFRLSLAAPVTIELDAELAQVSSLAALDFAARGLRVLERVGIAAASDGAARGAAGLFVAGDALAARPRGALSAASSGLLAAHSAVAFAAQTSAHEP